MAEVSVVMPVYNTPEPVLREAIKSILNQTYKDFEFLIINNGSDSDIKAIVDSYNDSRIRYFEIKENTGCAHARNLGLQNMRGKYYAVMDSDDIAYPLRLEKQINVFRENPDILLCASYFRRFPENKVIKAPENPGLLDFLTKDFLGHSTVMIKMPAQNREDFLYREDYEVCDDIDLYSRLFLKGRFYVIPEVLLDYRFEGKGISIKKAQKVAEYAKCIKNRQMKFLTSDKHLQKQVEKLLVKNYRIEKSLAERIFSIKNTAIFNSMYKVITIFNMEFKLRKADL